MKKRNQIIKLVILSAVVLSLLLLGCKGTTNSEESSFELLTSYLLENNLDINTVMTGAYALASEVAGNEGDYYILDIRPAADYDLGHLTGAVRVELVNIVTAAANSGGKPILIVCHTGQVAGHALVALRLSGFSTAKVLKFGMSSWNAVFDLWTANTGNIAVGHANWTNTAAAANEDYDYPDLNVSGTTGEEILAERVADMLAGGFKGVLAPDVLANPGNYFINNFWLEADMTTYGHFAGAYRIKPLTIAGDEISNLDPSETIVTYCWTGQDASQVTAYLTILGYDAKSMKYGVNALIYDNLTAGKWTGPGSYTYDN